MISSLVACMKGLRECMRRTTCILESTHENFIIKLAWGIFFINLQRCSSGSSALQQMSQLLYLHQTHYLGRTSGHFVHPVHLIVLNVPSIKSAGSKQCRERGAEQHQGKSIGNMRLLIIGQWEYRRAEMQRGKFYLLQEAQCGSSSSSSINLQRRSSASKRGKKQANAFCVPRYIIQTQHQPKLWTFL